MADITPSSPARSVVAFLDDHPKAILLLRMAKKRAAEMGAEWRAVFVETPQYTRTAEEGAQERMLRLLTLAGQMGGEVEHFEAPSLEKGMEQVIAREGERLALIIIGGEANKKTLLRTPPWIRAVRLASGRTQVEIVPFSGQVSRAHFFDRLLSRSLKPVQLLCALGGVSLAMGFALLLRWFLPPEVSGLNTQNIELLFIIACAFVAGRLGLMAGLVASLTSFLTLNYYFTVPYNTFKLYTAVDVLNMALFLIAALLVSLFSSQNHGYAEKTAKHELKTQSLLTLYRIASEAFSRQQVLQKLQRRLERMLEMDVAFFLPPRA